MREPVALRVRQLNLYGLTLLGIAFVGCWWRIRLLGDPRLHLGAFYTWFAAAFGCYLLALWLIRRFEKKGAAPFLLILGVAVVARWILFGTTPTLSDDIYRYRWDGRVQAAGIDPYAYPPNDPALAFLRDEQSAHINFPHLRTVYPPMTQAAFRLGASLGETLTAQKLVFLSAELLTVLSLLVILRRRGRSPLWLAAYAWHPLVVLEIAGSGHNDALGVAMLWLGIAAWEARAWGGSALAWAAAFLSKFGSIVMAPWWWCRRAARPWLVAFLFLGLVPLALRPTVVSALTESLSAMTMRFEANSSIYLLLAGLVHHAGLARILVAGLWLAVVIWWAKREADPVRYVLIVMGAAALLSPVAHPWYLVWLIPCFCLWRVPMFMALSGTIVLSYTSWPGYLAGGSWGVPGWARIIEYAPVLALGLWGLGRAGRKKGAAPFFPSRGLGRVGVIIPARNEAAALREVLTEIPRGLVREVIVVDNGSTDETSEVAASCGARVVREPTPGYGRACLAGLAALDPSVDTVVFLDGDHADYPEELPSLLAPIAEGRADLVIGSRAAQAQHGSLTLPQRLGNRLACALLHLLFGVRYTDLGPFRAVRRQALDALRMEDGAFGWTVEMQAKAARQGLRVAEVQVRYRPRIGRSKISGTLSGTVRAGVAILSTIIRLALFSKPTACADSSSS